MQNRKARCCGVELDMSNLAYQEYVKEKEKKSPLLRNMTWAFFTGGLICATGQGLYDFFSYLGIEERYLSAAVSLVLMLAAALLTAVGRYDRIAKHAGAGTLIPITGFANAIVAPAMEFRSEGIITGTAGKLFSVAGPVLVFGISASVVLGFTLYLFRYL